MQVDDVSWSVKGVQDNSNYPCDLNSISVSITPAVTIYQSCADYLEFAGFVGTMTDNSTDDLPRTLTGTSTQGVFSSNAVWTKDDGKLKVFLTGNLNAGTEYTFGFQVRNGLDGQGAQTISIEAPLVSSTNIVAMSGAVLEILSPDWEVAVSSSTSHPCAENTIVIQITPKIAPIQRFCDPQISLAGILGTTITQTEIVATAQQNNGFVATSIWAASTGTVQLSLVNDRLDQDVIYSYTFNGDNQPGSNGAQDVTFTNPSTFQSDYTVVPGSAQGGSFGFMEIDDLVLTVSSGYTPIHCYPCDIPLSLDFDTEICGSWVSDRDDCACEPCASVLVSVSGFCFANNSLPVRIKHNYCKFCLYFWCYGSSLLR